MNTDTYEMTAGRTFDAIEESAVRKQASSTKQRVVFFVVWAAVSVPMIWGVLKAWDEAKNVF